jgi:hypothetical protein
MGGVSAAATVTVEQVVAAVAVSPATATLTSLGETVQLTATARDAGGTPVGGIAFVWASGDASIASVDGSGLVTAVAEGQTTISATGGGMSGTAQVMVQPEEVPALEVMISVMPTLDPNSINLSKQGNTPVALLTTSTEDGDPVTFDAADADPTTIEFADAPPRRSALEDADGDGDLDLLLHFETQALNLTVESTQATLTGRTYDGMPFVGYDSVRIVGVAALSKGHGNED